MTRGAFEEAQTSKRVNQLARRLAARKGACMANTLTLEAAKRARELRLPRRTRSGSRERPWQQIADTLRLEGFGKHTPLDVADAVAGLPLEEHHLAPPSADVAAALERSWREGWAAEFPGEAWPGLEPAQKRLRAKQVLTPGRRVPLSSGGE